MSTRTYGFWAITGVFVLGMVGSGVADLAQPDALMTGMAHLGYPAYFVSILGTWKLLGVVALLAPGFPRVKEWAYAGFFFDLSGAVVSHQASGDGLGGAFPALALLLGSAMAAENGWLRGGRRAVAVISVLAAAAIFTILYLVHGIPAPGDIANALIDRPAKQYTLSLGHMGDLTLRSFAYLRLPLLMAGIAFLVGAGGIVFLRKQLSAYLAMAVMMVLFVHAARIAMITFDPYLSSEPLAAALNASPPGKLIVDDSYYTFSSVFFYSNTSAFLLNGRVNNLEYGSNAPGCPPVFLDDPGFVLKWAQAERYYVVAEKPGAERLRKLVGEPALHLVKESGGKFLFTNHADWN